jgi:hypothetical protein
LKFALAQDEDPSMHTFVLIVASSEANLVRDVCYDFDKATTKRNAIRQQIDRNREHAAAREDLLTKAEAKLSAAIAAVRRSSSAEG